jgi:uncharacterized protein YjiS (DUF1127 family)
MATTDLAGRLRRRPARHGVADAVRDLWAAFLHRREERRTLVALSRLGPRAMRDMGLDPEQVYEALGGRHEVLPINRSLLPKDTPL